MDFERRKPFVAESRPLSETFGDDSRSPTAPLATLAVGRQAFVGVAAAACHLLAGILLRKQRLAQRDEERLQRVRFRSRLYPSWLGTDGAYPI
jgi:hypothetical protein